MASHTVRSNPSSVEGDKHKHIDREIKDMISALTTRLTDLQNVHKPGTSHQLGREDELGVGVITLAGTNTGATMRGELLGRHEKHDQDHEDFPSDELEGLDTYVNSNFQAVNNSIMFGASYTANDPGVHMEVVDMVHGHKHGKKGAKKGKELAHGHGNPHSEFSECHGNPHSEFSE